MMKTYTALIMAGGTGGHIFPGLAVADELRCRGWKILWLGSKEGMENRLIRQRGIPFEAVRIKGVRSHGLWRLLQLPIIMVQALWDARRIFADKSIDIAIGFGGYVAFPGAILSYFKKIPLIIHEQNSVSGLTNRLLSKIARRVLYAFPDVFSDPAGCVGNPVRHEITELPDPQQRFRARKGPLRLLVIGGSLGAKIFNDTVPSALASLSQSLRPYVVHQAGVQQLDVLNNHYAKLGIEVDCRSFIDNMADEYAKADVVLCRSGALTVAELAAAGIGSLLVPYPFAVDNHQSNNAEFLRLAGAADVMMQSEFVATNLAQWIQGLTREKCLKMACLARKVAQVDAHQHIADICDGLVGK